MRLLPPLKIGVPIAVLIFGIIAASVALIYEQKLQNRAIEQRYIDFAEFMGTQVAAMTANFVETGAGDSAQRQVSLAAAAPNVSIVLVLDAEDRILYSSRYELIGQGLSASRATAFAPLIKKARSQSRSAISLDPDGKLLGSAFPFPMPGKTAGLSSSVQGVVFMEVDLSYPKAFARHLDIQRIQMGLAALAGCCLVFAAFFHFVFSKRIQGLADAARQIAGGNLSARAHLRGSDELARLGRAFDEMSQQLELRDKALLDSEHRFRQMADNIGEIFWLYDFDERRVLYVNDAFETIFARPRSSLLNSLSVWKDSIHPEDSERVMSRFDDNRDSQAEIIYRITQPSGAVRWLRDRSFPIQDTSGKVNRMAGIAADITEQQQAAEEKAAFDKKLQETQRLESLGVLAGGIAHDFNNLLTGVLGNASLARMVIPQNAEAQRYLNEIEAVSIRAAELCKQMLAYSGKARFDVNLLDLSSLVQETTQLLKISIAKNAVLRFDLSRDLPPIMADSTQLRQVIMNLVINASEALSTKSGTISLHTGVVRVDRAYLQTATFSEELKEGDYVYLEVADNGTGMDQATLARIFEPFFTTKFTGRGLGLSAVLGIVRGHKGALKAYSEPGKGTLFKLFFPVASGHAQQVTTALEQGNPWRGEGTVLVVDDEDTVRTVAARMLESFGFQTVLARDGLDAVNQFSAANGAFAAVLMDLTMPHLDGEEAFRRIRQMDPKVRVILMSGFNELEAINRFTGKGLAGFLQKPFKPEQLKAKLRSMMEGSKL